MILTKDKVKFLFTKAAEIINDCDSYDINDSGVFYTKYKLKSNGYILLVYYRKEKETIESISFDRSVGYYDKISYDITDEYKEYSENLSKVFIEKIIQLDSIKFKNFFGDEFTLKEQRKIIIEDLFKDDPEPEIKNTEIKNTKKNWFKKLFKL